NVPNVFHYGCARPNEPITSKTIYGIGSVTKVSTATLAAYLMQYWNTQRFSDFATQTSGMPDEANGPRADQLFGGKPPSCSQLAWWNDNHGRRRHAVHGWPRSTRLRSLPQGVRP